MNRTLTVALVVTGGLSAAVLWQGAPPPLAAAAAVVEARLSQGGGLPDLGAGIARAPVVAALPETWRSNGVEPASRDFFSPPAPPAPPVAAPAPVVAAPMPPAPPPAPAMNYRFLGHMVTPQGERLVYLGGQGGGQAGGQGEQAVAVKAGDRLADGWVVDSLDAEGVHLLYPAGQQRAVISVPSGAQ